MPDIVNSVDSLAGRITNRLLERLPGPLIDIPTATPVVSFTFDDVPHSALSEGAAILERYDARGTFYIAGGMVGQDTAERRLIDEEGCAELARRGHELGCHTFAHPNLRHLHGDALARDLAANHAFLSAITPHRPPTNFAYPYNSGSFRARALLADRFRTARGGLHGINRGPTDRTMLRAMPIEQPEDSVLALHGQVDALVAHPGWLIFFTHDLSETPTPYGCTPGSFEALVRHTRDAGCTILTVDAALDYLTDPT
jgi:peptidoglycan/xylan/chitin deacetylase (PgdA/CDA1 family)